MSRNGEAVSLQGQPLETFKTPIHDWFLLMSSNHEEYCNSHNHQLLLQQHSNDIVSFFFSLLGHYFGRCWITPSRLHKRLQARHDELIGVGITISRQNKLIAQCDEIIEQIVALHDKINTQHEALIRRFQLELQQLQDHNLVLNNKWHCILPSIALSIQASADANKLNDFYEWLGKALMQNTSLRHLILENMTLPIMPTTTTSLAILARGLNQSKVESLTIKHNKGYYPFHIFQPNDSSSRYLGQFLSDVLTASTLSPSLNKLTLAGAELSGTDEMALLAEGVSTNKSLTSLVIDSCFVNESGLQILFSPQGLWNSSTLLHLQLKRCDVGNVGVEILVEHWPQDSPVQTLSFPCSRIGPRGAQLLVLDAAHSHPALQALDISNNYNIDHDTLQRIGDDLPNQLHLTSLDLSCCVTSSSRPYWGFIHPNISLTACKDKEAGHALVQGIQRNQCIQHLNVLDNLFSCDVEMELDFHTSCNRMRRLLLSNYFEVPLSCWSYILAKCQHHLSVGPSLLMFCLQENPNLVPTQGTL